MVADVVVGVREDVGANGGGDDLAAVVVGECRINGRSARCPSGTDGDRLTFRSTRYNHASENIVRVVDVFACRFRGKENAVEVPADGGRLINDVVAFRH